MELHPAHAVRGSRTHQGSMIVMELRVRCGAIRTRSKFATVASTFSSGSALPHSWMGCKSPHTRDPSSCNDMAARKDGGCWWAYCKKKKKKEEEKKVFSLFPKIIVECVLLDIDGGRAGKGAHKASSLSPLC